MSVEQLLADLRAAGIDVWREGDAIRYRAAAGAMTAPLRDRVLAHKPALLRMLPERASSAATPTRHVRPDVIPASFAQERLYFADAWWEQGSPINNVSNAARLRGPLDVEAFRASFRDLVARHETLRTALQRIDGRVVQAIEDDGRAELDCTDLSHLDDATRERTIRDSLDANAQQPFAPSRAPLIRARLLRVSDDHHVLSVTMHHAICDAWSFGVLLDDWGRLYASRRGEGEAPPPLSLQFADIAIEQRERSDETDADLTWWREELAGVPILALQADRPRPLERRWRGGIARRRVGADAASAHRRAAAEMGVSAAALQIAAYALTLHAYTRQHDLAIGTPLAGRDRPAVARLIALLLDTVVLRLRFTPHTNGWELARAAQRAIGGALEHRAVPFDRIVTALAPEREPGVSPLFQVMFASQDVPMPAQPFASITLEPLLVTNGAAKYDLTLSVAPEPDALTLALEYNLDLFAEAEARQFLACYERALAWLSTHGRQRLSSARLVETPPAPIDPRELAPRRFESLARRFERHVDRQPEAIAVTCVDGDISYARLDRLANGVAHGLIAAGLRPGEIVAILLDRSIDLIAAILGVWKAGAGYAPLDPDWPEPRIAAILGDTGARFLVTRTARSSTPTAGITRLEVQGEVEAPPERQPLPADAPAYVMYTSGSTGAPKGVLLTQGNLAWLLDATAARHGFDARDVWPLFHTQVFDLSIWEIAGALLHGGRLVIVPYLVTRDPEAFHDLLVREQVTVLTQTPSAFRLLRPVAVQRGGGSLALRLIVFAGEALDPATLAPWFALRDADTTRIANMYGITETTVHVTDRRITDADVSGGVSPIGEAMHGMRIHLLDEDLHPVPLGVAGEIYVSGDGVALGYLGKPGATASRFVPDPFAAIPGTRMYRSGDLARRTADGELEFLRRADDQIKIRGFRVEPAEVAARLRTHPRIRDAVVVPHRRSESDVTLAAFIVPALDLVPGQASLRDFLADWLPAYMLPESFTVIDRIPLTANGKLDRRALPMPAKPVANAAGYEAPRNDVEAALARAWSATLGVEPIGIHDNFFAIGGDSIRSLQVLDRLKQDGLAFSVQDLFRHQTIASLAGAMVAAAAPSAAPSAPAPFALVAADDRARLPTDLADAYPLTELQSGMFYEAERAPTSGVYHNVDSFPVTIPWPFDESRFHEALADAIARHAVLRTGFDLRAFSEPLQLVHATAPPALAVRDLRGIDEAAFMRCLHEGRADEARRRFDPSRPPLLRFTVHVKDARTFWLTVTELHAILDGWSLHTILVEVLNGYVSRLTGRRADLAPLPAWQFRDYVQLERETVASPEAGALWRTLLRGATASLLSRQPASREAVPRIQSLAMPIESAQLEGLRGVAAACGAPLKTVLLAAHLRVLSLALGVDDVISGVAVHGRPDVAGADRVCGLFLNTLPFRLQIAPGSWLDLVAAVLARETEVTAWRRYPLSAVQRQVGIEPLLDVNFNFMDFHVLDGLDPNVTIGPGLRDETTEFAVIAHFTPRSLQLQFDAERVPETDVEMLADSYRLALDALAWRPRTSHAQTTLMAPVTLDRILGDWSGRAARAAAPGLLLHRMFEEQAAARRTAIAVWSGDECLTFDALNRHANAVAHRLRELGVGPEVLVAVGVPRSIDAIVAIVAILKAGGAYVPIDPDWPDDRVRQILARVSLVLTNRDSDARIGAISTVGRWCVASGGGDAPIDRGTPNVTVHPDNLAYVIHTSGSTGAPRGVMVTHRAVCHHTAWFVKTLSLAPGDRVLQNASLAFDMSVAEIFAPLAAGAALVIASREERLDPVALLALIARRAVTVMELVPSQLRWVIDRDELGACPSLRAVVAGGEVLPPILVRRFSDASQADLYNVYGPTETTVHATVWRCARADAAADVLPQRLRRPPGGAVRDSRGEELALVIPIGRPIPGARAYILDREMQPVPPGACGELYLGGIGLARGYAANSALTAERWLPDPFGGPGDRVFRTGDRARWRHDGAIEYVGRTDDQVKIRGFRVQLEEVTGALCEHPDVLDAAATLRQLETGARLIGYVVPRQGRSLDTAAILAFVRTRLPDFMVPSPLMALDALPGGATGKVDTAALPVPAPERPLASESYVAPSSPEEAEVAAIWADVLGVDRVGVTDNFFALGGDSILALRVAARLNQRGFSLTTADLFRYDTVAELTRALPARPGQLAEQGRVSGDAALSPAQRWFLSLDPALRHHWNWSTLLVTPRAWTRDVVRRAAAALLERHDALNLRLSGPPYRQWHADPDPDAASAYVDLSTRPDAAHRAAIEAECAALQVSLDLERGPLFRLASFDRGADRPGRLLVIAHHWVADALSWQQLLADLHTVSQQIAAGRAPTLGRKTVSFQAWAARQSRDAAVSAAAAHTSTSNRFATEAILPIVFDAERTRAFVRSTAGGAGRADDLLLAAFVFALARGHRLESISMLVEQHGRDGDLDVSQTIGWFTALRTLRIDVSSTPTPTECAAAVGRARAAEAAASDRRPLYAFNYVGRIDTGEIDQRAVTAPEDAGPRRAPHAERPFLLELSGGIVRDRLELALAYSTALSMHRDVEALAASVRDGLDVLLREASSGAARARVAAVGLDPASVSSLLADFE